MTNEYPNRGFGMDSSSHSPKDQSAGEHTWSVDSIEEGVVRVEEDGARMLSVPAHLLPAGITEGQILRVTRTATPAGSSIVVSLAIDVAATASALDTSARKTAQIAAESRKGDRGGDVVL
ncbi:hypothetical protein BH09GEM1_BH09GEM1_25510 [soil metagenome]